jgi:putative cardiolipin synthase
MRCPRRGGAAMSKGPPRHAAPARAGPPRHTALAAALGSSRRAGQLFVLLLLAALAGCASLPPGADYPRTASHALAADNGTRLGRLTAQWSASHDGLTGFRLLPGGIDSFTLRAEMADAAERTLDAQYFILHEDDTGRLFVSRLLAAADRGVRVRLLLDDSNTVGGDDDVVALAAHPNIEVRLFNPFRIRPDLQALRPLELAFGGFERLDYRMHNKLLITDNAIAVAGGRNIGDEYFAANRSFEFGDFDVFAAGPAVQRLSHSFDAYWNSKLAVPVKALSSITTAQLERYRKKLDAHRARMAQSDYERGVAAGNPLATIVAGTSPLEWARAEVLYDSPDKQAVEGGDTGGRLLHERLMEACRATRRELVIVTPYLVPGADQLDMLYALRAHGVQVRILTNSLASTDVPVVHAGYRKLRVPMLEHGIELYEVKPQLGRPRVGRMTLVREPIERFTLHAKVFVFDRARLFVGSANFDMRSFHLNTEVGLIIDSPALAAQAVARFDAITVLANSYHLTLGKHFGDPVVRWITEENGQRMILDREPGGTFWREFVVGAVSILPIDNQL